MKRLFLLLIILSSTWTSFAQDVQTIKGQVLDAQSEIPLIGATVEWMNDVEVMGTVTDIDGYFVLENIPIGRQSFKVSYLGYETVVALNVLITSGKQVYLDFKLEESVTNLKEIVVT